MPWLCLGSWWSGIKMVKLNSDLLSVAKPEKWFALAERFRSFKPEDQVNDKPGLDMRFGGGTQVVKGNSDWPGVGHNSAYTFKGTDYLVFHGYDVKDKGRSKLLILKIIWDQEGWPTVIL
jgi:arabinan endo-1,5-alpha-L-arabinosidase